MDSESELSLVMKYYSERTDCSAFTVKEIPGSGRGLVAVRKMRAGEKVVVSQSAVRGPCARAPAQCVNCLKLLQPSPSTQCRRCLLQVCSEGCSQGTDHVIECKILTVIRTKLKRSKQGEKVYRENLGGLASAVTSIRMVSLKWRDPQAWTVLCSLMDENINPSVWSDISTLYQNILHLDPRLLLTDLRRAFGVQSTNGALLHLPPGHGRGLAVYPLQAFLNHSCRSNTSSQDFPREGRVEIRARRDISAGEEITTSYMRPRQDTQSRRQLLAHTWHFWCQCDLCRDPSEGGTNLSAVVCVGCGEGSMLPEDPLDLETCWTCSDCGSTISHEEHEAILSQTVEIINSFPKENISSEQLEEMLEQLGKYLTSSHWMVMEIKQKLVDLYISAKNLTRPLKERKIELCRTVIDYMEKMDPGNEFSQRKLQMMTALIDAKIDLATADFRNGVVGKDIVANLLLEKRDLLQKMKISK